METGLVLAQADLPFGDGPAPVKRWRCWSCRAKVTLGPPDVRVGCVNQRWDCPCGAGGEVSTNTERDR